MRREEVRAFIFKGIEAIPPSIKYNSGRISEFAAQRDNIYPYVWSELLTISGNVWNVSLIIANLDKMDSKAEQYEAIIDECDYLAQQLIMQYRIILTGYDQIVLQNDGREPFVKKNQPDCTSGVTLTFELQDFSPTNVC